MSKLRTVKQKIEAKNQKTEDKGGIKTPAEEKTHDNKPKTTKLPSLREQLETLLATQPILRARLLEALKTGRFLISITYQRKEKPQDACDLHHWWCRNNFAVNDVLPSFRQIVADFTAKEMPNAEINAEGWF